MTKYHLRSVNPDASRRVSAQDVTGKWRGSEWMWNQMFGQKIQSKESQTSPVVTPSIEADVITASAALGPSDGQLRDAG